ncbi:N-acetyltransferase [Sphingosinicella rhizophila]|uniref:N-acetyltransferase n=1 Tax=Sphingosinicella rhizophila TaxID=3050082 RepID=A0ABU3Q662_9SPHN|nr:N-acetyltransferase [Sphingosinicella sp. GR2756]MDT9598564.1 N-acetyltransferase [Sphingosinicella sp. GR2756]
MADQGAGGDFTIRPIENAADRRAFVNLAWTLNKSDPHWVPPLKSEVHNLLNPRTNPWFEHAEARLFLAERHGKPIGRISAQVDQLVLQTMGEGTGQWGFLEAADEAVAAGLLARVEDFLRERRMTRSLGPFSLSIWDEPGLLIQGHDHSPTVMMGHNSPAYEAWVEASGYKGVKDLFTYDLDIRRDMPPLVQRIVVNGERSGRIHIRKVDKSRFDEEAALILNILNDAWSDNWGFIPLTEAEIAYAGKKLKPIVYEDLIRVAEVDGEPVAFMMALPDLNELTRDLDGRLFPFGWAKLLWRLRNPKVHTIRVPLMGVVKRLQSSRLASQLALMMVEYNRREAIGRYTAERGEIGWILDDNEGMKSIAETIHSKINRVYRIYEKPL